MGRLHLRGALCVAAAAWLAACGGTFADRDASEPPTDADRFDAGTASADAGPLRDAGVSDAGPGGDAAVADPDAGPAAPTGPTLYPAGARHSPIPADVAASIRAIGDRAARDRDALMKVGDSITVSNAFLRCFDGTHDLDGRPLDATVARFSGSWSRDSQAAVVGWSSFSALEGDPDAVTREQSATDARFSTLMFGTNDAGFRSPEDFARDVWAIAEQLIAGGTVPLMSTIPPRDDSASADARVPLYNLAVRAIAQGLAVPLVDLHRELAALPDHGLGGDGVHPTAFGGGCVLTSEGLTRGYNVRNLLTLEQVDRAARALDGGTIDADAPRLGGAGTAADPYVVPALPFAAMGDTRGGDDGVDSWACASADEGGPMRVYRLEVPVAGRLTAMALSDRGVDVDVHVLVGGTDASACVARDDTVASADVPAGVVHVAVDTFVGASERPGRFLVAVVVD